MGTYKLYYGEQRLSALRSAHHDVKSCDSQLSHIICITDHSTSHIITENNNKYLYYLGFQTRILDTCD
jgi:hypothetical protein